MKTLAERHAERRRRHCLRFLREQPDRPVADRQMQTALLSTTALEVSLDQIQAAYAWLAEAGLVTLEDLMGQMVVARITSRGLDVARGFAGHPGVAEED